MKTDPYCQRRNCNPLIYFSILCSLHCRRSFTLALARLSWFYQSVWLTIRQTKFLALTTMTSENHCNKRWKYMLYIVIVYSQMKYMPHVLVIQFLRKRRDLVSRRYFATVSRQKVERESGDEGDSSARCSDWRRVATDV